MYIMIMDPTAVDKNLSDLESIKVKNEMDYKIIPSHKENKKEIYVQTQNILYEHFSPFTFELCFS